MRFRRRRLSTRILVLGPDGSGKSTVTTDLVIRLRQRGLRVRHCHFVPQHKPGVIPHTAASTPHALPPRGWSQYIAVVARLAKYWRSALARQGDLSSRGVDVIIQERGWLDQSVDPLRYRIGPGGQRLAHLCLRLTPAIDGYIACQGDPATMVNRKQEISIDSTASQLRKIVELTKGCNCVGLDTTGNSVSFSVSRAENFVLRLRHETLGASQRRVALMPARLEMTASAKSRSSIRALYRPQSRLGLVARSLAVRSPGTRGSDRSELLAEIVTELGIASDGLASIRSPGRDRFVVAIAQGKDVVEFLKIATGPDRGLAAEASFLQHMKNSVEFRVPEVIDYVEAVEWSALRLMRATGKSFPRSGGLDQAVDVAIALSAACNGEGVMHGDFAPWNLLGGTRPVVLDWEHAGYDFRPGADLIHFVAFPGHNRFKRAQILAAFERYLNAVGFDIESTNSMWDQVVGFNKSSWDQSRMRSTGARVSR